jgi:hypothetical protein
MLKAVVDKGDGSSDQADEQADSHEVQLGAHQAVHGGRIFGVVRDEIRDLVEVPAEEPDPQR